MLVNIDMEQGKEYYAFISYKREDEKWAKWVQDKLEHYKFPTNLNGRTDLPKNIRPTFRDVTDLKPGLLAEEINNALRNSEWLIVVCSPRSAKSPWVCKEAQTFIDLGRADHIIPFVIEGNPFSNDAATECYPEALLNLTGSKELLAANINEMGREAAAIKVVARMFNLRFDALWQRYEREQKHKRWMWIGGSIFIALLGLSIALYFSSINHRMNVNLSRALAGEAEQLAEEGDSYLARLLASEALPPNRPYTLEAEVALRKAYLNNNAILKGHTSSVFCVRFSPDGKQIATASEDHTARIWDVNDGRILHILKGHTDWVRSLAYSPDGKLLATASADHTIRIWNTETGDSVAILKGHKSHVNTVAFSPDGKYLVSGSGDMDPYYEGGNRVLWNNSEACVNMWDVETWSFKEKLYNSNIAIVSVNYSPKGDLIAFSTWFTSINIFDLSSKTILHSYNNGACSLNTAFTANGRYVAYGNGVLGNDREYLNIVDTETWDIKQQIITHRDADVSSTCFSPDGKYLLMTSTDKSIRIWNTETGELFKEFSGHKSFVYSASFSPDGERVVSSSFDGETRIWDFIEKEPFSETWEFASYNMPSDIQFTKDGDKLILYPAVSYIDLLTKEESEGPVPTITRMSSSKDYFIDIKSDWQTKSSKISIYKYPTGELWSQIEDTGKVVDVDVIHEMVVAVTDTSHNTIRFWNTKTNVLMDEVKAHSKRISSIAVSPDDNHILTSSDDGYIKVWDSKTHKLVKSIYAHTKGVRKSIYSPQGDIIASISWENDRMIKIWNSYTGKLLFSLSGDAFINHSISFSPDGKYLVSSGSEENAKVWSLEYGEVVQLLKTGGKQAIFCNCGRHIVSVEGQVAPQEKTIIKLWDFPPLQELIDQTREWFKNRKLTPEERRKYYLE